MKKMIRALEVHCMRPKGNIDRYCLCMFRYLTWRLPTKIQHRTVQRYFRLHVVGSGGIWPSLAHARSRVKYQKYQKYHTTVKRVSGYIVKSV